MRTDRVLRAGVLAGLLAGGLSSAGCSSMNNTEKGAGIGGALGTAAGLGIGAATGNPRTGAVIGGLAGAGTGALIGNQADKEERRERDIQHATAVATAQAQQQRMGLFDVVDLTRKGHDDQVIINQIRATGSTFQLTASDLDHLKNEGVSSRVITEMQAARPVSPLATRVVSQPTVVVHEPVYPAPVIVAPRPYCYGPRPVVFVGGHYHHCR
jgi:hypothetical protein